MRFDRFELAIDMYGWVGTLGDANASSRHQGIMRDISNSQVFHPSLSSRYCISASKDLAILFKPRMMSIIPPSFNSGFILHILSTTLPPSLDVKGADKFCSMAIAETL